MRYVTPSGAVRIALVTVICASSATAQTAARTSSATPLSPSQFLGYAIGGAFTPHHRVVAYFEELDRGSEVVTLHSYGSTYEGRPLLLAVITSPANQARLESIRAAVSRLASGEPRDATAAAAVARDLPAVVWLGFGVHGNESSSTEAAMELSHSLATDPAWAPVLANVIVLIDPLQNPDGRERYVTWFTRSRGAQPNLNPHALEHREPWPFGRTNHYHVDLNRDWAWLTQRETRARVAEYRRWNPQVFVDLHEMSFRSSYFFPPSAQPINAHLPARLSQWLETFGRANAAEFTRRGWPFFVGEQFDLFYPGYGDSWPSFNGAVGMTYEVAGGGRGGLTVEREDGSVLTLAERVQQHVTAAAVTVRTAAAHREQLLLYTHAAARGQLDRGRNTYLISADRPNSQRLAETLLAQGITVDVLTARLSARVTPVLGGPAATRSFSSGTIVVRTRQPRGALAEALLESRHQLPPEFLREQREAADADEEDEFYDITAWSLPIAMNVETFVTDGTVPATAAFTGAGGTASFTPAAYGYVVSGDDPAVYRVAGELLRRKARFGVTERDMVIGNRRMPRGSLVILRGGNADDLDAQLANVVLTTGAAILGVESGWAGGAALGSQRVRRVIDPGIGLITGAATNVYSFGALWQTLDIDTPIPHSVLPLDELRRTDLGPFKVLIFPDGRYQDAITRPVGDRINAWVRNGGTLVLVKEASAVFRDTTTGISKLKAWEPPKADSLRRRHNEYRIPGAAFRSVINERSYLTFGVQGSPPVLITGTNVYLPVSHLVDNVVTIAARDPLVSGVAWPESLQRISGAAYLVRETVGMGRVITFADEPHARIFWRGTLPLFLNAVLYSPSFISSRDGGG